MRDPSQTVGLILNDVARLLRQNFNRRSEGQGLSLAQWRTLAHLAREEGVNQVTLAETLEVQPITLTRLLDRLQKSGFVVRRPDPDDRRAVRLYLTPKAQPLLARLRTLADSAREEAMAGLSKEARDAFLQTLQRMKQNLLEAEQRAAAAPEPGKALRHVRSA